MSSMLVRVAYPAIQAAGRAEATTSAGEAPAKTSLPASDRVQPMSMPVRERLTRRVAARARWVLPAAAPSAPLGLSVMVIGQFLEFAPRRPRGGDLGGSG